MKKAIIIVVIVLLLIIAGYFMLAKNKAKTGLQDTAGSATTQSAGISGVKESLLGLMQKGTGAKCSVEDVSGKYTVISKGDKVKIEGIDFANPTSGKSGEKGTMINDGTWAYMWGGNEGIKFNIKEMEKLSAQQGNPTTNESDWQDWAKSMEASGAKYSCTPTLATDADFTPPSDVKFQDFGELFKNLPNMQKFNEPG